jgi:alpha-L-arabinofuranosidase
MVHYTLKSELQTDARVYQTISYDKERSEMIIKLVNAENDDKTIDFDFSEYISVGDIAKIITLHAEDIESCNSIEAAEHIVPVEKNVLFEKNKSYVLKKNTFEVLRIKCTLV